MLIELGGTFLKQTFCTVHLHLEDDCGACGSSRGSSIIAPGEKKTIISSTILKRGLLVSTHSRRITKLKNTCKIMNY